ncbi:MAG: glycerophosphodiester phosphodiesterase, partial [Proteobacteria bacterium]
SGAEMVECDVQLSRDGHAVIFHDADLVRIGNSKEKFGELTAADLLTRVQAPTLYSLLTDADCPPLVNIEIKSGEVFGEGKLEAEIVRVVREAGASDRVLISSFNPAALRRVWKLAPDIPRALLVTEENDPKNKIYLRRMWLGFLAKPHLIHVDKEMITAKRMENWSDRGIKVAAWTVNDQARATELLSQGAISIISDNLYAKR